MISGVVRTSMQPAMQLLRNRLPAVRAVHSAFSATLAAFAHEASVWLHLVCVCVHCMVKILFASQEKKAEILERCLSFRIVATGV